MQSENSVGNQESNGFYSQQHQDNGFSQPNGYNSAPLAASVSPFPFSAHQPEYQQQQQQQQYQQQQGGFKPPKTAFQRFLAEQQQQQNQQNGEYESQQQRMAAYAEECGEQYIRTFYEHDSYRRKCKELKDKMEAELKTVWQAMLNAKKDRLDLADGSYIVKEMNKIKMTSINVQKTIRRLFDEEQIAFTDPNMHVQMLRGWLEEQLKMDCDYQGDIRTPSFAPKHKKLSAKDMDTFRAMNGENS